MRVTKIFSFAAGHRLYKYDGDCSNIHGHNYKLEVTVRDDLDAMGMVVDFKELKVRVNRAIAKYDHALILQKGDPLVDVLKIPELNLKLRVMENNPTAENMLLDLMKSLPDDCVLNIVDLRLWETETSFVEVNAYDLQSK
jgi:6-pyruvoyltetrahydropterin/6-carboxytetrahydropterin synthase